MQDTNQKKQKKGINPVAVAVTGAAIGAGVVVAGAIAMRNEDNRKKVKEAYKKVKEKAENVKKDIEKRANDKKIEVEEKVAEVEGSLSRKAEATGKALHTK